MKKGQTLSMDLLLGLTAFVVIFIAIFGFINYLTKESSPARIREEADLILEAIESQDNPFAIIIENELDQDQVSALIGPTGYAKLRDQIGTKYNFCIFFEDENGKLLTLDGQVANTNTAGLPISLGDEELPDDQNIKINGVPCGAPT